MKPITSGNKGALRTRLWVRMSVIQYGILKDMREAAKHDFPFVYFDRVHHKTRWSLLKNRWVSKSPGGELDRDRFAITQKGLNAITVYEKVSMPSRPTIYLPLKGGDFQNYRPTPSDRALKTLIQALSMRKQGHDKETQHAEDDASERIAKVD